MRGPGAGVPGGLPTWEVGCPLPENTVVSPLLCGVGFRLLPALISASSSELSPVGDIMLKDLLPARRQERRCWPGTGPASPPPPICPSAAPSPSQEGPGPQMAALQVPGPLGGSREPQRGAPRSQLGEGRTPSSRSYSRGVGAPPGSPREYMLALGPTLGTPANVSAQDTD